MKKIVFILLAISSFVYAKVNTVVSILPQKTFVEAIGGDKVNVSLMVKPGSSPHTYEPKPSQMKDISKADIYFSIGVEFEESWLPKFSNQNKNLMIVDLSKGIKKIQMVAHSHHEDEEDEHEEHAHHDHDEEHEGHGHHDHDEDEEHEHHGHHKHEHHKHNEKHEHHAHHEHDEDEEHEHHGHHKHAHHHHDGLDPHVWTSTKNVKIIAKNILDTLIKADKKNTKYYKNNYKKFVNKINSTDKKIKNILKNTPKDTPFMVFHPAWGYFAKDYDLEQVSIEISGKSPKPKHIAHIIEEAKEEKVKAIFTNPETSDKVANQIAHELGIPVVKISPLNPNWSQNLINLAKAIANQK